MVARLDRVFQGCDRRLIEGQVRYRGAGRFLLRIVATAQFTPADEQALAARFLLRVPGVQVGVERVAAIERGPNGKFEFIVIER
jgi:phenylacetate-CoA ligase